MMIRRLLTLYRVAGQYRLDTFIPEDRRGPLLRLLVRLNPSAPRYAIDEPGQRLRQALETLGPVFIKFGQLLSTRRDLLSDDVADQLAMLQDRVPPFESDTAVSLIEAALGAPIDTLFSSFEREPIAAASVAQVHGAVLPSGQAVVVKVLRPDIDKVIRQDLAIIKRVAVWVGLLLKDGKRLRPTEVAADYERTLLDELNLRREAANASQLRRNFSDSRLIYIPEIHWPLTTQQIMVSERISGIPVTDVATLHARQVNMQLLAERGVEIFFTQVFRDSFFHADMHPGNIFVDASDPEDPRYIAIDCAIVGQLDQADLYYLARNLLAIFRQDYRQVAKLHVECGWVPRNTPIAEFESAMRTLCEPVFERPLSEISFGHMLVALFRTAGRFDMEIQPQLVLLQKTLLNIEGLGRQLYPQLSLWDTAQPFLEDWLKARYAPQTQWRRMQDEVPGWLELLPLLPDLLINQLRDRQLSNTTPIKPSSRLPATLALVAGSLLAAKTMAIASDIQLGLVGAGALIIIGLSGLRR